MSSIPDMLDANTNHLGINDFIAFMLILADKSESHPVLKDVSVEYYTGHEKLREMAGNLGRLRDAAANGDKEMKAEKLAAWEKCKLAISMNAQHITMLSLHRNDPGILYNTGYPLKQKSPSVKPAVNLLEEIPQLSVKHAQSPSGPVSGAIIIILSRPRTTAPFELQRTENPADESSWRGLGIHTKSRIEYKGLESATRVYFRARYALDGSTGKWSPVASIIVL